MDSALSERSFATFRGLKTFIINTIGQEKLNNITILE